MNEEVGMFFGITFSIAIIIVFGFSLGKAVKNEKIISEINQKICKQLYLKDTIKYINCGSEQIYKNIELIKDITNDR